MEGGPLSPGLGTPGVDARLGADAHGAEDGGGCCRVLEGGNLRLGSVTPRCGSSGLGADARGTECIAYESTYKQAGASGNCQGESGGQALSNFYEKEFFVLRTGCAVLPHAGRAVPQGLPLPGRGCLVPHAGQAVLPHAGRAVLPGPLLHGQGCLVPHTGRADLRGLPVLDEPCAAGAGPAGPPQAPIAIEVFAGCAGLAQALCAVGFDTKAVDWQGNKHKTWCRTMKIDLTTDSGAALLIKILSDPRVVYVHWAPPGGTCSRAREKPLPGAMRADGLDEPKPLRSTERPYGSDRFNGTIRTYLKQKIDGGQKF